MAGPLQGVRIIELAGIGPGPFAAMLLADLGADVIRVDRLGPTPTGVPIARDRPLDDAVASPAGARTPFDPDGALAARHRRRPEVDRRQGFRSPAPEWRRRVHRGLSAGGDRTPRPRPGGLPCREPQARLRPDNRMGPGRARSPTPPATTSTTSRWPASSTRSDARASHPSPRSTSSGTTAAAGCSSRWACWRGSCTPGQAVPGRSWMRPWWTGPPCSPRSSTACGRWASGAGSAGGTCSTRARTSTRSTSARTASTSPWAPSSHSSMRSWCTVPVSRLTSPRPTGPAQLDAGSWPARKKAMAALFATRPRAEWCALLDGSDACVAPVLSMTEAPAHPHLAQRGTFARRRRRRPARAGTPVQRDAAGSRQPAPDIPASTPTRCSAEAGLDPAEITELRRAGVIS